MNNEARSPYVLSHPLYDLIQQADGTGLQATLNKLHNGIKDLQIEDHVAPVLSFDADREIVNVEPKDQFGAAICVELRERIAFPPCPDGMCEPAKSKLTGVTACKWCGKGVTLN